jgi:hypothetical protein
LTINIRPLITGHQPLGLFGDRRTGQRVRAFRRTETV